MSSQMHDPWRLNAAEVGDSEQGTLDGSIDYFNSELTEPLNHMTRLATATSVCMIMMHMWFVVLSRFLI